MYFCPLLLLYLLYRVSKNTYFPIKMIENVQCSINFFICNLKKKLHNWLNSFCVLIFLNLKKKMPFCSKYEYSAVAYSRGVYYH